MPLDPIDLAAMREGKAVKGLRRPHIAKIKPVRRRTASEMFKMRNRQERLAKREAAKAKKEYALAVRRAERAAAKAVR